MVLNVSNLKKSYGKIQAVKGISFNVKKGEIFGILGPNGAGKTTTIECIEGLLHYDQGKITILGKDNKNNIAYLKERIGVQLQEASMPARIKVWEALDLFASFYKKKVDWKDLLIKMDLEEKKNNYFSNLSGGQKQRLFIALALINNPDILFLDEITSGLDPQARRHMWGVMKEIKDEGKTIVMSTHYMEEAEFLCDRVIIIDKGRIIAKGTPRDLIDKLGIKNHISLEIIGNIDINPFKALKSVVDIKIQNGKVEISGKDNTVLMDVSRMINKLGIKFTNLQYNSANLEDVYLCLTGYSIRD